MQSTRGHTTVQDSLPQPQAPWAPDLLPLRPMSPRVSLVLLLLAGCAEAPRGVYAAEAYGRRLSLTERLRGKAAALPLAREYLERFPEGAYAPSARALVEHR